MVILLSTILVIDFLSGDVSGAIAPIPPSGAYVLPGGSTIVTEEIKIPDGAHDLRISGEHTLLKMAAGFRGRAILSCLRCRNISIQGIRFEGNSGAGEKPVGLPPYDTPFYRFTIGNGLLFVSSESIVLRDLEFEHVSGFAVLAAACSGIDIERLAVSDAGGRGPAGRNNATGGILLEEGCRKFRVVKCAFTKVAGNGVWTHSLYTSARNAEGRILSNTFTQIGRDAIQAGHAENVLVQGNVGDHIGYPSNIVDVEGGGTPVAIDTAGNVSGSVYTENRFREINGKCIDLDGFHDGSVTKNVCVNDGKAEEYPFGHFAIVMNNSNPDMTSQNIEVSGNRINGTKYGGIFVIGKGHRIENNILRRINLAACNESGARFGCLYSKDEPGLLKTGVYLGRGGERPAPASGNRIRGNRISGYHMKAECVGAAPQVSPQANQISGNQCTNEPISRTKTISGIKK